MNYSSKLFSHWYIIPSRAHCTSPGRPYSCQKSFPNKQGMHVLAHSVLWEDPPRSAECSNKAPASLLPASDQDDDFDLRSAPELDEYRSSWSVAS